MNRFTKTSVIFLATLIMLIISPALMSQMAQETIGCYCVDPTLMTDKPGATFGSFAEAGQACMIEGERWETNGYLSGSLVTTYVRPFSQQVTDPDKMDSGKDRMDKIKDRMDEGKDKKDPGDPDLKFCYSVCDTDGSGMWTKCVAVVQAD